MAQSEEQIEQEQSLKQLLQQQSYYKVFVDQISDIQKEHKEYVCASCMCNGTECELKLKHIPLS